MKQVWQIDPEFKRLSVPLSPEEERRLEHSLIREGCKEPIAVWHGCILDGHKRYEICSYEEMEYETVKMDFATKDEALLWACKKRLATVKPSSTAYRYLLGKRYGYEKKRYKRNPQKVPIMNSDRAKQAGPVCCLLADEATLNYNTIKRYSTFAIRMDIIAVRDIAMFEAILAEKIPVTYADVTRYSTMDSVKLVNVRRKLLREKDVKMRQRKPRKKATEDEKTEEKMEQAAPLEMGIKEMPVFDPDMEFRGLALTIPTWMNAIARSRAKTNIDLVSEPTKAQLAVILRRLEEQITQTLEVIEK